MVAVEGFFDVLLGTGPLLKQLLTIDRIQDGKAGFDNGLVAGVNILPR